MSSRDSSDVSPKFSFCFYRPPLPSFSITDSGFLPFFYAQGSGPTPVTLPAPRPAPFIPPLFRPLFRPFFFKASCHSVFDSFFLSHASFPTLRADFLLWHMFCVFFEAPGAGRWLFEHDSHSQFSSCFFLIETESGFWNFHAYLAIGFLFPPGCAPSMVLCTTFPRGPLLSLFVRFPFGFMAQYYAARIFFLFAPAWPSEIFFFLSKFPNQNSCSHPFQFLTPYLSIRIYPRKVSPDSAEHPLHSQNAHKSAIFCSLGPKVSCLWSIITPPLSLFNKPTWEHHSASVHMVTQTPVFFSFSLLAHTFFDTVLLQGSFFFLHSNPPPFFFEHYTASLIAFSP